MSRIGKLPVAVPEKVTIAFSDNVVTVKGPKGELSERMPIGVTFKDEGKEVLIERNDDSKPCRAAHGLARTLVANMVHGVANGYERALLINGVGYRAEQKGKSFILFTLGYSHPILYELPVGMEVDIDAKAKEPKVTLRHWNKQVLGSTAAEIRSLRPPEPYKGKGIRYADEVLRRKEGKAGGK
jgi:large subunit ribosomal protein L6